MRSIDSQKTSSLDNDLLVFLTTLGLETSQSHERILKETQYEKTSLIEAKSPQTGSVFRLVKKEYSDPSALSPYEAIRKAQNEGSAFSFIPHVVSVSDTPPSVLLTWLPGKSLRAINKTRGFSEAEARAIMKRVASGLDELHTKGKAPIIHRDLTPSNILYDEKTGVVNIIDLGIARTWDEEATQDTQKLGTPIYAAPEQYGYSQTSAQTDIFAAGMVYFFLLAGKDPSPQDIQEGFLCISEKPARAIIQKATAFDPKQRFQTARELLSVLENPSLIMPKAENSATFFLKATWNTLLATTMLFLLVVCVYLFIKPNEIYQQFPKAELVLALFGIFPLFFVGLFVLLVFPSDLPKRIAHYVPERFSKRLLICAGCLCLSFILFCVLALAFA